jgi:amino-acid N-acetyltransferase
MEAKVIDNESSLSDLFNLLRINNLPYEDIKLENNHFVNFYRDGNLIGSGGLEFYPPSALLRSLAVVENQRGKSIGKKIVQDLLERAKQRSITKVYLLTETAHDFFVQRGFVDIQRDQVPEEIKLSSEFRSVCPVSAACMVFRF